MSSLNFDNMSMQDLDKLTEHMLKNPDQIDNFVANKVTKERVDAWKKKKEQTAKPAPSFYLKYLSVDYKKKENTKAHNTTSYVNKDLVVRRAATFDIELKFKNRAYNASTDSIVMEFGVGKKPNEVVGSKLRLTPGNTLDKDKWSCKLEGTNDGEKTVSLKFNIPKDAIIGRHNLTAEITTKATEGTAMRRYFLPDVLIVFNPFSEDDDVYMPDEQQRKEYVMNEQGMIWGGTEKKLLKLTWTFGQFDQDILDIIFRILNEDTTMKLNENKAIIRLRSPVTVSRVLSAMLNDNDDNGVLVGNWSGEYSAGKAPTAWSGSAKILRQWNKSGPVKFGQCWVFSGVFTTALRALGIPSRSVTNFQSAHDTEYNMTLDKFFYADGSEPAVKMSNDSVWNFHVWNDAWMKRPDLGKEYDGWQAVDATPQEKSEKIFQCGPSPLKAIINGDVNIGFDTQFLFGEVNADECKFLVNDKDKIVKMIGRVTNKCGQLISTKAVGKNERHDITNLYKYKEGSTEERAAMAKAQLRGKIPTWQKHVLVQKEGEVTIDISNGGAALTTGARIPFVVKVTNTTNESQELKITARIDSMMYNNVRKSGVKQVENTKTLAAKESFEVKIEASFAEYGFVLSTSRTMKCIASVTNTKTNATYIDHQSIVLKHPKVLTLTPPTEPIKAGKFEMKYELNNHFPVSLTNCNMSLEGVGIDGEIIISNPIVTNGKLEGKITGTALRTGSIDVMANFESRELSGIKGKCKIQVQ